MKKTFIVLAGVLWMAVTQVSAQLVFDTNGNWTTPGSWALGTPAGVGDDAYVNGGGGRDATVTTVVTVQTVELGNSSTLTVDAGGDLTIDNLGFDALTTNNTAIITVDGDLTINGNLVVNNGLTLNVTGNLIINGDVTLANNASLDFSVGSTTTITGDFTAGTNADITVDGDVDVAGSFTTGGGVESIGGGGTLDVTGACTGALCGTGPLPIELLSFNARVANNQVSVDWATASEENFDYFSIERSSDGLNFVTIGSVTGNGNSFKRIDYSYSDNNPLVGLSYYRLMATDLDGSFEIFDIVGINYRGSLEARVFPNPASSSQLQIRLNQFVEGSKVIIHNLSGKLVLDVDLASISAQISLPESIPNGIYLVTVQNTLMSERHRLVLNR